jgi:hypothetical protein
MSFCGSRGAEIFEPLSFKGRQGSGRPGDRCGYADRALVPAGGDFEKYISTYRIWGRMLYDPETGRQGLTRQCRRDFGPAAAQAQGALGHASRILPLVTTAHLPSASNNNFWPEMYTNMPVASDDGPGPYTDTPSPRRFGTVSPLDPQLFSRVEDHADARIQGRFDARYSPVEVAQWLEDLSQTAFELIAGAEKLPGAGDKAPFRRLAVDVRVQGGLGRFFGKKLRAGVLFALFERTGDPAAKAEALRFYRAARDAWAGIVATTAGVYVADVAYGDGPFKRGNWSDRLAAIDQDIAAMDARSAPAPATPPLDAGLVAGLVREFAGRPQRPYSNPVHISSGRFQRGRPVNLGLAFPSGPRPASVLLNFRRVNQAEAWRSEPMEPENGTWRASIPSDYADTGFPLQYYFSYNDPAGRASLYPGLGGDLTGQPYFVLRQA